MRGERDTANSEVKHLTAKEWSEHWDSKDKLTQDIHADYLRPGIRAFAQLMELRLRRNEPRQGQEIKPPEYYLQAVTLEVNKALEAIRKHEPTLDCPTAQVQCWNIVYELADAANYLLMAAEAERRKYDR